MSEFISKISPDDAIPLLAVACGTLCGLVMIGFGFWYKVRKTEIAASLKQDMLNRGMSADEIKTVLDAGAKPPAIKIDWKKNL